MQAGVPMVPIVLRNAGEVMWRGAQTVRPGTLEVVVLPPVDTDDWTWRPSTSTSRRCGEMFVETLDRFPGTPELAAPEKEEAVT